MQLPRSEREVGGVGGGRGRGRERVVIGVKSYNLGERSGESTAGESSGEGDIRLLTIGHHLSSDEGSSDYKASAAGSKRGTASDQKIGLDIPTRKRDKLKCAETEKLQETKTEQAIL